MSSVRLCGIIVAACLVAAFPRAFGFVIAFVVVALALLGGFALAVHVPRLADEVDAEKDVFACHPCRGCGAPVSGRARYCGERCKRAAARARNAAKWLEANESQNSGDIPF